MWTIIYVMFNSVIYDKLVNHKDKTYFLNSEAQIQ